jgi:hypothetical protein
MACDPRTDGTPLVDCCGATVTCTPSQYISASVGAFTVPRPAEDLHGFVTEFVDGFDLAGLPGTAVPAPGTEDPFEVVFGVGASYLLNPDGSPTGSLGGIPGLCNRLPVRFAVGAITSNSFCYHNGKTRILFGSAQTIRKTTYTARVQDQSSSSVGGGSPIPVGDFVTISVETLTGVTDIEIGPVDAPPSPTGSGSTLKTYGRFIDCQTL